MSPAGLDQLEHAEGERASAAPPPLILFIQDSIHPR